MHCMQNYTHLTHSYQMQLGNPTKEEKSVRDLLPSKLTVRFPEKAESPWFSKWSKTHMYNYTESSHLTKI